VPPATEEGGGSGIEPRSTTVEGMRSEVWEAALALVPTKPAARMPIPVNKSSVGANLFRQVIAALL
jgi:hypothetical protein